MFKVSAGSSFATGSGSLTSVEPKMPESAVEISLPSISSAGKTSLSVFVGAKPAMALFKLLSKSLNETSPSFSSSAEARVAKEANGSSSSVEDSEACGAVFSAGVVSAGAGADSTGAAACGAIVSGLFSISGSSGKSSG